MAELSGRGWDARTEIDLSGEPESLIFLTLRTPNDGHRYDLTSVTSSLRAPSAPRHGAAESPAWA
jgi:UDPglucose 6-dehydrogenase